MTDITDAVLEQLVKDVELAVHALYRGEVRQATAKARTGHLVRDAAARLKAASTPTSGAAPVAPPPAAPTRPTAAMPVVSVGSAIGWTSEQGDAVMKCVMGWLPMGAPSMAAPEGKCVAAGREMVPTWGQRELARAALRSLAD